MATADLTEIVARIESKLDAVLNGKPESGQPGIWIRLDRAEQILKTAMFIASTAFVAAVTAVVSAFTGHK